MKSEKLKQLEGEILLLPEAEKRELLLWVNKMLSHATNSTDINSFAGTVKLGIDGVEFQRKIRAEWG